MGPTKLAVGGASPGRRCFSEAAQAGHQGLANGGYQVWVRKTLEIQGICEYGSRFTPGVFSDFADDCLSRLENKLTDNATAIDWSRSRDSSRFPSNFKLAFVLNSPPENMHEKHWLVTLRDLKTQTGEVLKDSDKKIHRTTCFAALQAAPWRRELYGVAGKMTSALMALAGQKVSETRRECTKSGATWVYCMAEKVGDKNSVVLRGPTQTTATGGGLEVGARGQASGLSMRLSWRGSG